MLTLLRKSDASAASSPLWHPNFRNFERLPDTKVVRTTFFINASAITLAASLAIWAGYREFRIRDLDQQITETQTVIDKNAKQSNEAIRLTAIFAAEEKKFKDVGAFTARPFQPSEFILLLGQTLPKNVQVESVDMQYTGNVGSNQCTVRGVVAGSKDQASGYTSNYIDTLRTSPLCSARFESVNLLSLNPDPTGSLLRFEIVIKLKPAGSGKKS